MKKPNPTKHAHMETRVKGKVQIHRWMGQTGSPAPPICQKSNGYFATFLDQWHPYKYFMTRQLHTPGSLIRSLLHKSPSLPPIFFSPSCCCYQAASFTVLTLAGPLLALYCSTAAPHCLFSVIAAFVSHVNLRNCGHSVAFSYRDYSWLRNSLDLIVCKNFWRSRLINFWPPVSCIVCRHFVSRSFRCEQLSLERRKQLEGGIDFELWRRPLPKCARWHAWPCSLWCWSCAPAGPKVACSNSDAHAGRPTLSGEASPCR